LFRKKSPTFGEKDKIFSGFLPVLFIPLEILHTQTHATGQVRIPPFNIDVFKMMFEHHNTT